jgi:hypothetical protein
VTEREWRVCTELVPMLEFLRGKASDRKLRLFAVACCRKITHLLDARSLAALAVAERFTEGLASIQELAEARVLAYAAYYDHVDSEGRESAADMVESACSPADDEFVEFAMHTAWTACDLADVEMHRPFLKTTRGGMARGLADLLRELVGNPFRIAAVAPEWLAWGDGTVVKLSRGVYDEEDFDRLPVLADALEDAGCQDAEILGHLRGPGHHVRGCYVLDLLLQRE